MTKRRAMHFAFAFLVCSCWSLLFSSCSLLATVGCPENCTCAMFNQNLENHPALSMSCRRRQAAESDTALTREIDALPANNTHLKKLTIIRSPLTQVPEEVCNLTSLEVLRLSDNQLVALPDNCFSRLSRLEEFSASNNRITYLQDGLFDGLMFLKKIDLSNNSIEGIGLRVFSNVSDLPRLRYILLSNNKLRNLEPWPIIRAQARSRNYQAFGRNPSQEVDKEEDKYVSVRLDRNTTVSLKNSANWTYSCDGKTVYFGLLLCLDYISATQFIVEYFTVICELPCILPSRRFSRYSDPLFACVLLQFYESFGTRLIETSIPETFYSYEVYVYCSNEYFFNFFGLAYYHSFYQRNYLENVVCHVKSGCPEKCLCFTTPYNATLHVLCGEVELKEVAWNMPNASSSYLRFLHSETFSFVGPDLKYDYDISGNSLTLLETRPYFKNTAILKASNSGIKSISAEALIALQQADKIYLHDNLLTTLPRVVTIINFSFSALSLHGNPFDCSCEQAWLEQWLSQITDRLDNRNGILCKTPPRLHGNKILDLSDSDFCPSPDARIIASAIVAPLVCIATAIVLLRIFRVETYKRFRFHPFDRDECAGEEMTYDVFISYARGDKELARRLLEFLENNGCKVCFHQRDFMAGELIMENILEAVYTSKRVLCLVTANFLQSRYCLDEFTMAQTRNVELKKRRIIIVKYEQFDIGAEMNALQTNKGKDQNPAQSGSSTTAAEIQPSTALAAAGIELEPDSSVHFDKALVLRDFVTRHTFINLSVADSWRDQLLYAMPINRLGQLTRPSFEEYNRDDIGMTGLPSASSIQPNLTHDN